MLFTQPVYRIWVQKHVKKTNMATPFKNPRDGILYFRREVPEKLRPAFNGKREVKVSLGTRDATEAKARADRFSDDELAKALLAIVDEKRTSDEDINRARLSRHRPRAMQSRLRPHMRLKQLF